MNIEARELLSARVAKTLSGLSYEKAEIKHHSEQWESPNNWKGFHFEATYQPKALQNSKTDLDRWLTERYCLYFTKPNNRIVITLTFGNAYSELALEVPKNILFYWRPSALPIYIIILLVFKYWYGNILSSKKVSPKIFLFGLST